MSNDTGERKAEPNELVEEAIRQFGDLDATREYLQSIIEEQEVMNEELRSANEEIQSSNEELQSTNEELQSVNEELYTVNAEYQRKIAELTELIVHSAARMVLIAGHSRDRM